ncbi:MAG: hypothetical protein GXO03_06495 [Aquificae bacterium]|nr:hypothetical protein [Aquificota bacterium]
MEKEVRELESLLFKSTLEEIRELYKQVLELYEYDGAVRHIADELMRLSLIIHALAERVMSTAREGLFNLLNTLYGLLKEIVWLLTDFYLAFGQEEYESVAFSQAFDKLVEIEKLLEKLG